MYYSVDDYRFLGAGCLIDPSLSSPVFSCQPIIALVPQGVTDDETGFAGGTSYCQYGTCLQPGGKRSPWIQ
ncbi:hypothetical protein [Desulfocicer niacini]